MSSELLNNITEAILYFVLNPVWLAAVLAAVLLGYVRVKRERRDFTIRVLSGLTEMKHAISSGWLYGLVLSILIAGAGLTVDFNWIVLLSVVMLLAIISFSYKLASPVYYAAIAFFGLYALDRFASGFSVKDWFVQEELDFFGTMAVTVPVIAGLFLVTEGLLIRRYASRHASPFLTPTKRGLRAAVYQAKLLWIVPIVLVVPGHMLAEYVPYWPQFTLGSESFSLIPVPLVIGFSQMARASFPDILFPKIGAAVAWLGIAVAAVGIGAIWMPVLGWAALIAGVVCRIFLSILLSITERKHALLLVPQSEGIFVVSVLEDSPAEKMGIIPGDLIKSVNGITIHNEDELYDAIQINAAHCRLQVIGRDGEVRLKQQVLYRHDHFRLGMLVVR
ncbi:MULTISPECIES: PDZ domain-containing protein [Sporosarcina]|uniref:PDZ domain-containing protein n=1 Tax=Sporosarcina TaxID=1569 RepID=UPI0018917A8A|nr:MULTISPECIES: PDZ domain-containing protein [Sporosarcina]GKV65828.1 cell division topological determinant MinJ [Sporosarcina sp. NCCP-2331]GLB55952.1 cell division topological determinant MinJ [Sporosarcina sp. NCCP-2378]